MFSHIISCYIVFFLTYTSIIDLRCAYIIHWDDDSSANDFTKRPSFLNSLGVPNSCILVAGDLGVSLAQARSQRFFGFDLKIWNLQPFQTVSIGLFNPILFDYVAHLIYISNTSSLSNLFNALSIYLSVCLSIYLYIDLSFYLSIYLSI